MGFKIFSDPLEHATPHKRQVSMHRVNGVVGISSQVPMCLGPTGEAYPIAIVSS